MTTNTWQAHIRSAVLCMEVIHRFYYKARFFDGARPILPYAFEPVSGTSSHHIILNRDYRPLGMFSYVGNGDWFDYNDFPNLHVNISSPAFKKLIPECLVHEYKNNKHIYTLFDDSHAPWGNRKNAEMYLKKLLLIDLTQTKGD